MTRLAIAIVFWPALMSAAVAADEAVLSLVKSADAVSVTGDVESGQVLKLKVEALEKNGAVAPTTL